MKNRIKRFNEFLLESVNIDEEIKQYVLVNYIDDDILVNALSMKYGGIIPLYHATDEESAKIIEIEGLRPVEFAKNRTTRDECIYFQIDRSDYVSDNRPILFKWNCTLEYIGKYAYIDTDSVSSSDDELKDLGFNIDDICSDSQDFLSYFVANDYKLAGMEIFFTNRDNDPEFPKIIPKRIN